MRHMQRCPPTEGCCGRGWVEAPLRPGGTTYCGCLTGRELRAKDEAELDMAYRAAMEPDPNACSRCGGNGTVPKDEHFDYCDCAEGVALREDDAKPTDPLTQMAVARAMGRFHQRLRELEREAAEDDGDWT